MHARQEATKALIRLPGCAGYSVPLLFAFALIGVSNFEAQIIFMGKEHKKTSDQLVIF